MQSLLRIRWLETRRIFLFFFPESIDPLGPRQFKTKSGAHKIRASWEKSSRNEGKCERNLLRFTSQNSAIVIVLQQQGVSYLSHRGIDVKDTRFTAVMLLKYWLKWPKFVMEGVSIMQTLMPNQMIHPERNDQRSKDPSEDYTAEASPLL